MTTRAAAADAAGAVSARPAVCAQHETLPLLRFITCGSVDDGKSTLIGRLLHDSGSLPVDQLATLTGTDEPDFAQLVDGLEAEREQGITIDVAYRYFQSARRRYVVADCPGHEQYTRNMATGASTADLAVVLVDARKGVLVQTRRHARILRLFGIDRIVLAVNKMDCVDWDLRRFEAIAREFEDFARGLGIDAVHAIPLSARCGDNVVRRSPHAPWYRGPTLLATLDEAPARAARDDGGFCLPVQWINRPHQDFRGIVGTVVAGRIAPGDAVRILPAGSRATIARVIGPGRELTAAAAGQPVTLSLHEDVDVARGDLIVGRADAPIVTDRLRADVVWLDGPPLAPGRRYRMRVAATEVIATVAALEHVFDPDHGSTRGADGLAVNGIGRVELALDRAIAVAPFAEQRVLGALILIDRVEHGTVGAGVVVEAIARGSARAYAQAFTVGPAERAAAKGQKARCLWFTGLSGAGKSTLADALERRLAGVGAHTMTLDGDNLRRGLCSDLGYAAADRSEHVRRLGEVARLMVDAGLIVLVSAISPYRADRDAVRRRFAQGSFVEIHVDASPATCAARDPKGLYARAAEGGLPDPIGIGGDYEAPLDPELHLCTDGLAVEAAVDQIVRHLERTED